MSAENFFWGVAGSFLYGVLGVVWCLVCGLGFVWGVLVCCLACASMLFGVSVACCLSNGG